MSLDKKVFFSPLFGRKTKKLRKKEKEVLGLTATPFRKDGLHPIILMQCGPLRHQVQKLSPALGQFRRQVVIRKTSFQFMILKDTLPYKLFTLP